MTMPKAGLLRALLMNHTYHHRGQLSVYLRLLDVPVPPIYGPSADESPFGNDRRRSPSSAIGAESPDIPCCAHWLWQRS